MNSSGRDSDTCSLDENSSMVEVGEWIESYNSITIFVQVVEI